MANFSLSGKVNALSCFNSAGNIHRQRPRGAHPALTCARRTGAIDHLSETTATTTGALGDHVAKDRAHGPLERPGSATDIARAGGASGRGARPITGFTHHSRVNLNTPLHPENHIFEVNIDPQQRILAALLARAWPLLLSPSAKEVFKNIAKRSKTTKTLVTTAVVGRALRGV